jgi:hypothetical protein
MKDALRPVFILLKFPDIRRVRGVARLDSVPTQRARRYTQVSIPTVLYMALGRPSRFLKPGRFNWPYS